MAFLLKNLTCNLAYFSQISYLSIVKRARAFLLKLMARRSNREARATAARTRQTTARSLLSDVRPPLSPPKGGEKG